MNQVARVFVVLNLLLAVAFLFTAATFLALNNDYKGQFEAEVEARKNDVAAKDAQIRDLNTRISELEGLERTLTEQKSNLQGISDSMRSNVNTLESSTKEKDTQIANLTRSAEEAQSLAATLNAEKERLREELTARAEESRQKTAEAADALKKLSTAQAEIVGLNNTVSDYEVQVENLKGTVGHQELVIKHAASLGYDPSPLMLAPPLNGRVTNANSNIAMLNVGSDAGVKAGYAFDITRNNAYICRVVIDEVGNNYSAGKITVRRNGASPQAGDRATTSLN